MKVENAVIKGIKMKWDGVTFPLKEGTPIDIGGNVANNGKAIGLVIRTVKREEVQPGSVLLDNLFILVGGDVMLEEIEKAAGITLTTEAKASMSGIRFHLADGKVDDSADQGYTLPAATATKLGGVKIGTGISVSSDGTISVTIPAVPVAENVAASEASDVAGCVTSINAILSSLKAAGLMAADAEAES